MATDQRSLPAFFNTDADFQAFVAGIHAQLAAIGLVNTADTGQINPATVTKATVITTAQGYEIWRFNDALQSSAPVYVKVEYGSAGAVDRPSLWFTVGTGSNGAGTITGQVGARRQVGTNTSKSSGVTLPAFACGDTSGLVLMINYDSASGNFGVWEIIDRTRDGTGAATADGIITFNGAHTTNAVFVQVIPAAGAVPAGATSSASQSTWFSPYFASAGGGAGQPNQVGSSVPVVPLMAICGKFFFCKMAHLAVASTLSVGIPISVSTLGGTHTLMPLATLASLTPGGQANDALCVLWE